MLKLTAAIYLTLIIPQISTANPNCTCLPFHLCSEQMHIMTNKAGVIDTEKSIDNKYCKRDNEVCCNPPKEQLDEEEEEEDDSYHLEEQRGCGFAAPGTFPWTGALLIQEPDDNIWRYICATSLIHKNVALTAAHCVDKLYGKWIIRIGEFQRLVKEIIIHPRFRPKSFRNDIALLIFDKPVTSNPRVAFLCIPPPSTFFEGVPCAATSWSTSPKAIAPHVNGVVSLKVIDRGECVDELRSTTLGPYFKLHRSFICAEGESHWDVCGGEGGAPLVCPVQGQPGRFYQVGLLSWEVGCGYKSLPEVYVNVGAFRNWIDGVMISKNFDVISYRY